MRSRSAKVQVARLADRQSGRVGWAQLEALGVESVVVARWVVDGYLHHVHPRVYAVGHRAPSAEADLTAAVLYAGPGAMLSHATALWWRGLIDRQPWPIEVSTPRRCRSLRGIKVHSRRDCRRVWHKGLPVTTLEQALLDFAAVAPLERVRYALVSRRLPEGARPPRSPGDLRERTGRERQARRQALETSRAEARPDPQPARADLPAFLRVARDPVARRRQRADRGRPRRRGVVGPTVGGRA